MQRDKDTDVKARDGNQTLARGLRVMLAIADSGRGLSVQQVGDLLGVHRSIAYRIMQTLADFGLATRNRAGLYVPGARMATLAGAYLPALRDAAEPVMQQLANKLQSTVLLFVEQHREAQAVSIIEPTNASYHISFQPGMKTPLDRGASGYSLLAARPPTPDEPPAVTLARQTGYARSHGEVRPGAFAVSAWIPTDETPTRATLSIVTYTEEIADKAGVEIRRAADKIGRLLDRAYLEAG
ncbi:IclR family transcriptional regulator [Nocardioides sp. NPDC051685]|uniref:IclR family transcriptional regulator n=1 Tax=Nocardioides sp. NPDC051685 TaxID=3364334 RepID=UPI00378D0458